MGTTREFRQKLKRRTPKVFLAMEHVEGARLLPSRLDLLDRLPKGGVCAEIGCAFGDFTREILARTQPKKLHLIDAWNSERYKLGLEKVKSELTQELSEGRVEINQGFSTERLPEFDNGYFDWIYIDSDHSYKTTRDGLSLGAMKVKPGGRIAGHDFTSGNPVKPVAYGVIEACNEFCVSQGWRYEYLTVEPWGHNSFCLVQI